MGLGLKGWVEMVGIVRPAAKRRTKTLEYAMNQHGKNSLDTLKCASLLYYALAVTRRQLEFAVNTAWGPQTLKRLGALCFKARIAHAGSLQVSSSFVRGYAAGVIMPTTKPIITGGCMKLIIILVLLLVQTGCAIQRLHWVDAKGRDCWRTLYPMGRVFDECEELQEPLAVQRYQVNANVQTDGPST